jgi:hypothetical protein
MADEIRNSASKGASPRASRRRRRVGDSRLPQTQIRAVLPAWARAWPSDRLSRHSPRSREKRDWATLPAEHQDHPLVEGGPKALAAESWGIPKIKLGRIQNMVFHASFLAHIEG